MRVFIPKKKDKTMITIDNETEPRTEPNIDCKWGYKFSQL